MKMLPLIADGMKHVCYFRHALALDERRVKFLPLYVQGSDAPNKAKDAARPTALFPHTKEVWFAGTHTDM